MNLASKVLSVNNDLPIRTYKPVHSGKIRSVYWLTDADSKRLIQEKNYNVAPDASLAVMIISDRLSAFDCIWRGEGGMNGVPGKGAALNAISNHWFQLFREQELANSHIIDIPHPLVWVVQRVQPIMIEAVCRQYITGAMWRSYEKGEREYCGIILPDGLKKDQKLEELLITPSTKGILQGISGVPEVDDANISRATIEKYFHAFNFRSLGDIDNYETLLKEGFNVISESLSKLNQIFVDTKFEFGYIKDREGNEKLIYMDEVGTPDSSRIWDGLSYSQGVIVENSKEAFRKLLLQYIPESDILLNPQRMPERRALAKNNTLPEHMLMDISAIYLDIAEKITGSTISLSDDPRAEIVNILNDQYGLISS